MNSAEVNALPERVRRYIHDLETRCDPSGEVRELFAAKENMRGLARALWAVRVLDRWRRLPGSRAWTCHGNDSVGFGCTVTIPLRDDTTYRGSTEDAARIAAAEALVAADESLGVGL